jgi:ATP-dependent Clp protease adaptor protein ClpS
MCLRFNTAKSLLALRQQSDMLANLEARSQASFASISSTGFYICTGLTIEHSLARAKWSRHRKGFCVTVAGLCERRRCSAILICKRRSTVIDRPYSLFELKASYVSVSTMSRERRRGVGCRAQSKDTVGTAHILAETGTVTTAEPTKETRSEEDLDLPWQVIVHNDPVNLMSYVTMVFQRVFGYPREKAERHMLEVHHKGRSILWAGMREPAELYVQQLHGYLLLATLEKIS